MLWFTVVMKSHQGSRLGWTKTFLVENQTDNQTVQCRDLGCMHESFGKRGSRE